MSDPIPPAPVPPPPPPRAAWIEIVPEAEATGELAAAYAAERDPRTGRVDHVLAVHSLITRRSTTPSCTRRASWRSTSAS